MLQLYEAAWKQDERKRQRDRSVAGLDVQRVRNRLQQSVARHSPVKQLVSGPHIHPLLERFFHRAPGKRPRLLRRLQEPTHEIGDQLFHRQPRRRRHIDGPVLRADKLRQYADTPALAFRARIMSERQLFTGDSALAQMNGNVS